MRIFLTIYSNNQKVPEKMDFKGSFAVETLLIKVTERYFGTGIALRLEDMLKVNQTKKGDN